jgi:hypothetical protein
MSIRVNVSEAVAQSESRDIEPVPAGKYLVQIDGAEIKESQSEKNKGKPYVNLELTIVEPEQYTGRKVWWNVMLFGDAYSAVWLGKALGFYDGKGDLEFPEPGDLLGQRFVAKAVVIGETRDKNDPSKVYAPKNEVKGAWNESTWTGANVVTGNTPTKRAGASILP